jgi:magnesium chelatase family protein
LQIQRYVGRISGPLLDRIDIHIDVPAVKFRELTGDTPPDAEDSAAIRQRIINARDQQRQRFTTEGIFANAAMTPRLIRSFEFTNCKKSRSRMLLSHQKHPQNEHDYG